MKKNILMFVAFAAQINFAQSIFPTNGANVGIGTTTPGFNLSLYGANTGTYAQFTHSGTGTLTTDGFIIGTGSSSQGVILNRENTPIEFYTNNIKRLDISSSGNVGIGTSNPLAKLEVNNGSLLVRNSSNVDNESSIMIAHSINISSYNTFGTSLRTITQSAGYNTYGMQFFTQESYLTGQTEKIRISGNGNVGIGTVNPLNKLDVNGTIHSKEVKVDMSNWSDFVFKKEYNLPTLEEVEKHINEKGHLQNIPSEAEVLKNGISLGEMNAKLLQKIEEMTLYMIEMKKDITILKQENKFLKSKR